MALVPSAHTEARTSEAIEICAAPHDKSEELARDPSLRVPHVRLLTWLEADGRLGRLGFAQAAELFGKRTEGGQQLRMRHGTAFVQPL
eukprot:1823781-Prymnesium_polylepis.1